MHCVRYDSQHEDLQGIREETVLQRVRGYSCSHTENSFFRHYPTTVASVVTDTPEMRRLAENTKLQSQVKQSQLIHVYDALGFR